MAGVVGRAIAKQRIRSGLTQEEVAERLGVGNEAVSRIERGVVIPNIGRLLEFAALFRECLELQLFCLDGSLSFALSHAFDVASG
ncbi:MULTISPECIES: helix-turn-helix transcriptional regulator [unclassified Pseudomonas]